MEILLDSGTPIEERDRTTRTPLCYAAFMGQEDAVRVLIQRGADLNAKMATGATPLLETFSRRGIGNRITKGQAACARLLIEAGADVNAEGSSGEVPIYKAASAAEGSLIRLLLARGAGTGKQSDWAECLPRDYRRLYLDSMAP
jgi:ankyrin repeat protein